jgi:hypothetical protein
MGGKSNEELRVMSQERREKERAVIARGIALPMVLKKRREKRTFGGTDGGGLPLRMKN